MREPDNKLIIEDRAEDFENEYMYYEGINADEMMPGNGSECPICCFGTVKHIYMGKGHPLNSELKCGYCGYDYEDLYYMRLNEQRRLKSIKQG